jgi:TrmH family RNA methyltransferase
VTTASRPRAEVRLVLVRPETPGNVGACARVVRNGGLAGLDLVDPGDWRTVECWRTAWGAHEVLESARVFPSLDAALAEATWVGGLSGRPGGAPAMDVREMAAAVAALSGDDRVALVLGPEAAGLSKAELARCGRAVLIPAHPDQPSLNLSHAAAVAAYEVFRAARRPDPRPRAATRAEKTHMLDLLREGLLRIEALPRANTDGYFQEWEALFLRADLTPKEVRLLEHMARKMPRRGGGEGA